jgi:hypothetical protein
MERLIEFLANHPYFSLAIWLFVIGGVWKTFSKAGQPGWAAIVPIYNLVVMARIAAVPMWTLLLFFVPVVNVLTSLVYDMRVAARFGRSPLFGFGLFFLPFIFWPVLGYGSSRARLAP